MPGNSIGFASSSLSAATRSRFPRSCSAAKYRDSRPASFCQRSISTSARSPVSIEPTFSATSEKESAFAPRMRRMSASSAATSKPPFPPFASLSASSSSARPAISVAERSMRCAGVLTSGGTTPAGKRRASAWRRRRPLCAVGTTTRMCASDFTPAASVLARTARKSATASTAFRRASKGSTRLLPFACVPPIVKRCYLRLRRPFSERYFRRSTGRSVCIIVAPRERHQPQLPSASPS